VCSRGRAGNAENASKRHFDRWAAIYSRSYLLGDLQRKGLIELAPRESDRLLDVGCGAGELVHRAAPTVARAVGVDLSPQMIERARQRGRNEGIPPERIEFVVASSSDLPFGDSEFTAVITTTALHHFPNPAAAVREMVRVLAPGGRIVIADLSRDLRLARVADALLRLVEPGHVGMQTRNGIERLLRDGGVRVSRSRRVWLGSYALVAGVKPI
jgi:ubiquinone/menaquinone biosynthesis C-methylase UbiE